jgi:hypothetical protein
MLISPKKFPLKREKCQSLYSKGGNLIMRKGFPTHFLQKHEGTEFAASAFPLVYALCRAGNEGETIIKITTCIYGFF